MPAIISVVGKSDSGKTTLVVKLVRELKKRGYSVGTVKHASHGFEIDREGKDSWHHKAAGADMVIVAGPGKIAIFKDIACETLDCLSAYFQGMDIVIAEGFKRDHQPKIEIYRPEAHKQPLGLSTDNLIAFVSDTDLDFNVPKFGLDDIIGLADLIEHTYL